MMTDRNEMIQQVYAHARKIAMADSTMALLEWDQHTYIPQNASEYRSEQVTWLSGLRHQYQTDPAYGDSLQQLWRDEQAAPSNLKTNANLRGLLREYNRNVQLPENLVKAMAKATSFARHIWVEARSKDDFKLFLPSLREIIKLRREEATILQQPSRTKYDALLDQYEDGADSNHVAKVFSQLRDALVPIVRDAAERERKLPKKLRFEAPFDFESQRKLSLYVAEQIGFQFERGRLDETAHPFCTTLGPDDHRILTRYLTESYSSGMYGVLHEAGHGMYEQGTPVSEFGLPAGMAASLGVHESQSRLWENMVGRSRGFWRWLLPEARKLMPALKDVALDAILADVNRVEPSLIRVEADEATYNLHIFVRFEIEKELIDGNLEPGDLPSLWNQRYQDYLGITPVNNAVGVLQDVHWSAGLVGYFPTYTLGNLYAAQLFATARKQLGDVDEQFAAGEFRPLLNWLRDNVHSQGRCYLPHELMQRVNGRPLDSADFISYLKGKLA
jgi:carboxypeptidase Taq